MLDIFLEEGHILVLNSFTRAVLGWGWSWWLIPIGLLAIAGILAVKIGCSAHNKGWFWVGVLLVILFPIIGLRVASQAKVVETYEVYEITMDNYVPFKEFNEVCEVLDHRGDIYTVRLKEAGD